MAYPAQPNPLPFYRPRRLPRVLRRQAPVLRLCAALVLFGLLAATVAWRNLTHDRLVWDVGRNRAAMDGLNTEILHLNGQIEVESSYARVTRWAENMRHWKVISGQLETFVVPETALPAAARKKAEVLQLVQDE